MSPRTLIKEIYKGPKSQQVPGLVPAPPNNATTILVFSNWAWAQGSRSPLVALWAWEAYNEPIGTGLAESNKNRNNWKVLTISMK